ncbi:MAG: response regulator transcription factor [Ruminococcaceae bacterium]|nr:response regulator transcription factor [Oscillospiraceae bacterium]
MKIAVVDDIKEYRETSGKLAYKWAKDRHEAVVIKGYKSGESFLRALEEESFDIVFMDIYMDGLTGIEAAAKLREISLDTLLIFMTTSMDHMADAFPCRAFDYIMKPVDEDRLFKALDQAVKLLPENMPYITINCDKQDINLLVSDIVYVLSDLNYCLVHTKRNEYRIRSQFSKFMETLSDFPEFCVINRGVAVNLDNVTDITDCDCTLSNGETLLVSKKKKNEVSQALIDRRFEVRRKAGK